jgi:hypothetical protein
MMLIDATVVIEYIIRLLDCVCVCVCVFCFLCVWLVGCQKPVFLSMNIATIIYILNCCCYLKSCNFVINTKAKEWHLLFGEDREGQFFSVVL